jgi:hypothetical protein
MPDNRTKAEKLRALYRHPRTSIIEREAAKLALERLGERVDEPVRVNFNHNTPPPSRPNPGFGFRDTYGTFSGTFTQEMFDNLMNNLGRKAAETTRRNAAYGEELRRAGEAVRRANEEAAAARQEAARKRALSPCPGCAHTYDDHIGWRCYACHPNAKIELAERRAAYCGWMPFELKTGGVNWSKIETSWGSGPNFIIYDEKKEDTP